MALERPCPGISSTHYHDHAFGARMVDGKSVGLAAAAGHYPVDLVQTIAKLIHSKVGDPWLGA